MGNYFLDGQPCNTVSIFHYLLIFVCSIDISMSMSCCFFLPLKSPFLNPRNLFNRPGKSFLKKRKMSTLSPRDKGTFQTINRYAYTTIYYYNWFSYHGMLSNPWLTTQHLPPLQALGIEEKWGPTE